MESLRTSSIKLIVVRHEQAGEDHSLLQVASCMHMRHAILLTCNTLPSARGLHGSHCGPAHR